MSVIPESCRDVSDETVENVVAHVEKQRKSLPPPRRPAERSDNQSGSHQQGPQGDCELARMASTYIGFTLNSQLGGLVFVVGRLG